MSGPDSMSNTSIHTQLALGETQVAFCLFDNSAEVDLRARLIWLAPEIQQVSVRRCEELSVLAEAGPLVALVSLDYSEVEALEECIASYSSLQTEWVEVIALIQRADEKLIRRLFAAGVSDYLTIESGSSGLVADYLYRRAQRLQALYPNTAMRDRTKEGGDLAAEIRRVTFTETVATLNHQINNPLSVILGDTEMMLNDSSADLSARTISRLRQIHSSAAQISAATERLSQLRDPQSQLTPAGLMIDSESAE